MTSGVHPQRRCAGARGRKKWQKRLSDRRDLGMSYWPRKKKPTELLFTGRRVARGKERRKKRLLEDVRGGFRRRKGRCDLPK